MDYGLLTGLAEGIKQGTASYSQARQNRLAEEDALEKRKAAVAQAEQERSFKQEQLGLERQKLDQEAILAREKMANELKMKKSGLLYDPKEALAFNKAQKEANDPYNKLSKAEQLIADEELKTFSKRQGSVDKLSTAISQLESKDIPDDEKVVIGQGILKLLNDPEVSDAIGKDEAERIGAYLQQFSLTRPGSTFGRDLPRFTSQVKNKLALAKGTQEQSRKRLEEKGLLQSKSGLVSSLSPEDEQAMAWAKANPNDKRSAQILQRLGVQNGIAR